MGAKYRESTIHPKYSSFHWHGLRPLAKEFRNLTMSDIDVTYLGGTYMGRYFVETDRNKPDPPVAFMDLKYRDSKDKGYTPDSDGVMDWLHKKDGLCFIIGLLDLPGKDFMFDDFWITPYPTNDTYYLSGANIYGCWLMSLRTDDHMRFLKDHSTTYREKVKRPERDVKFDNLGVEFRREKERQQFIEDMKRYGKSN